MNHLLADIQGVVRAKRPQRLPVVLTQGEIQSVLQHLEGIHWLVACLLLGVWTSPDAMYALAREGSFFPSGDFEGISPLYLF